MRHAWGFQTFGDEPCRLILPFRSGRYAAGMGSIDDCQQRAVDNERLRRLVVEELESTRDQLADTVNQLQTTRADLIQTNTILLSTVAEHEVMTQEKAKLSEALAQARDTVTRQQAYINRLKMQLDRPLRQVAKKAARTLRSGGRR